MAGLSFAAAHMMLSAAPANTSGMSGTPFSVPRALGDTQPRSRARKTPDRTAPPGAASVAAVGRRRYRDRQTAGRGRRAPPGRRSPHCANCETTCRPWMVCGANDTLGSHDLKTGATNCSYLLLHRGREIMHHVPVHLPEASTQGLGREGRPVHEGPCSCEQTEKNLPSTFADSVRTVETQINPVN